MRKARSHGEGVRTAFGSAASLASGDCEFLLRLASGRFLGAIGVLVVASMFTFSVLEMLPGDAAQQTLGPAASSEQIRLLQAQMGLDKPPVERYLAWFGGMLRGDAGRSIVSGKPVADSIVERLPVTLELVAFAFLLATGCAIFVALVSALHSGGWIDQFCAAACMAALSVPNYVFALTLVAIFSVSVPLFPTLGFTPVSQSLPGNVASLTLPAIALGVPLFGLLARLLRSDLLDQMSNETYIVAAAAKGLSPAQLLHRHALRNSLFGLLTVLGVNLGTLIGGTVVIEQIFALPGLGQLLLRSINTRDVVVVQAVVFVFVVVTVAGNLLVDMLLLALDPRIRNANRQ